MSYHRSARKGGQLVRRARAQRAMGDTYTDAMQGQCSDPDFYNSATGIFSGCQLAWPDGPPPAPTSDAQQCVIDSATLTAPLDAKIADLAQNWKPTGFYLSADLLSLVKAAQQLMHAADSMLTNVGPSAGGSDLANAQDELFRHEQQALVYIQAAGQAQAANTPVNAPGLKDWVINSMNAASAGMTAAYVVSCMTPWWVAALAAFQSAFDALWNAAKAILGVVIKAGQTALKVTEETLDILKYVPYAAAAVAAYIAIIELKRYKKRRA